MPKTAQGLSFFPKHDLLPTGHVRVQPAGGLGLPRREGLPDEGGPRHWKADNARAGVSVLRGGQ